MNHVFNTGTIEQIPDHISIKNWYKFNAIFFMSVFIYLQVFLILDLYTIFLSAQIHIHIVYSKRLLQPFAQTRELLQEIAQFDLSQFCW